MVRFLEILILIINLTSRHVCVRWLNSCKTLTFTTIWTLSSYYKNQVKFLTISVHGQHSESSWVSGRIRHPVGVGNREPVEADRSVVRLQVGKYHGVSWFIDRLIWLKQFKNIILYTSFKQLKNITRWK